MYKRDAINIRTFKDGIFETGFRTSAKFRGDARVWNLQAFACRDIRGVPKFRPVLDQEYSSSTQKKHEKRPFFFVFFFRFLDKRCNFSD